MNILGGGGMESIIGKNLRKFKEIPEGILNKL